MDGRVSLWRRALLGQSRPRVGGKLPLHYVPEDIRCSIQYFRCFLAADLQVDEGRTNTLSLVGTDNTRLLRPLWQHAFMGDG